MITLTDSAADEIHKNIVEYPQYNGIRIDARGGGCAGMTYNLSLESSEKPGDEINEKNSVKIYYNSIVLKSYLDNMTIDFVEGLMGGFKFINPNATATCGCGESFGT